MRILNLYSGIGGNRAIWSSKHKITAVELDPLIASVYKDKFPNDEVIVGNAHEYLEKNYSNYDFIWSSPPCQTHSRIITSWKNQKHKKHIKFPDMKLYQEIIFLKKLCDVPFVIENVIPYYEPLIQPDYKIERHFFWSNIKLKENVEIDAADNIKKIRDVSGYESRYKFNIKGTKIVNKRQVMRNLVNPEIGRLFLESAEQNYLPIEEEPVELESLTLF